MPGMMHLVSVELSSLALWFHVHPTVMPCVDPRCVVLLSVFLRFLADYDEQFPLADDISLLQQVSPHLYPLDCAQSSQAVMSSQEFPRKYSKK